MALLRPLEATLLEVYRIGDATALQDLKIKKPPYRVNAHLPLGLYVDAKKNVLVLALYPSKIST